MKSQSFPASINKGSKELFISSGYDAIAKNGAFVKIGTNEVCYQIESYNVIDIKKKFKAFGDYISIKGDYREKIFSTDSAQLYFNEKEAVHISEIINPGDKSSFGEIFKLQEGHLSSSRENLSGTPTSVKVTSVGNDGLANELRIEYAGRYLAPPINPVKAMNEAGHVIEINIEFDEAAEASVFERDFKAVTYREGETLLHMVYPFPHDIKEGELIMQKKAITLDREYASDSQYNVPCQTTSDFTPLNQIPLMPPNCIAPHTIYNKGVEAIDKRLLSLQQEIEKLKKKN